MRVLKTHAYPHFAGTLFGSATETNGVTEMWTYYVAALAVLAVVVICAFIEFSGE